MDNFEAILAELQPVTLPEEAPGETKPSTLYDALERLVQLSAKAGKSGLRATQATEHIQDRLDTMLTTIEEQIRSREEEVRKERENVGQLEEDVETLVSALADVLDLSMTTAEVERRAAETDDVESHIGKLHRHMLECCHRAGLEPTATVDEKHDPTRHEAIDSVEGTIGQRHAIVEVVRQGYRYNGRIIRIAKVVVSS